MKCVAYRNQVTEYETTAIWKQTISYPGYIALNYVLFSVVTFLFAVILSLCLSSCAVHFSVMSPVIMARKKEFVKYEIILFTLK